MNSFANRIAAKSLSAVAVAATVAAVAIGINPIGPADAASPRSPQPGVVEHSFTKQFVSATAPSARGVLPAGARPVAAGETPKIRCGQVLTTTIYTAWDVWGTSITLVSMQSQQYTVWCSGKVYVNWYKINCNPLTVGLLDFTCVGNNSHGVIGNGTSEANPWYNQPVVLTYWSGPEPWDWTTESGTAYCRTYMWSNGKTNEWCSLSFPVNF